MARSYSPQYFEELKKKGNNKTMTCILLGKTQDSYILCSDSWNTTPHENKIIQKAKYDEENNVIIAQYGTNSAHYNEGENISINVFDFMDDFLRDFKANDFNKSVEKLLYSSYKLISDLSYETNDYIELGYIVLYYDFSKEDVIVKHIHIYKQKRKTLKPVIEILDIPESCIGFGSYAPVFNQLYLNTNLNSEKDPIFWLCKEAKKQSYLDRVTYQNASIHVGGDIEAIKINRERGDISLYRMDNTCSLHKILDKESN